MNGLWLVEDAAFEALHDIYKNSAPPTAEALAAFEQTVAASDGPANFAVKGSTATVRVAGLLTDQPDFFAHFFGGGNITYSSIREGIAAANADTNVKSIDLDINSPGGMATAEWFETMAAVKASEKPVRAMVGRMAASAAYGIASQAGEIVAQNDLSAVGSVGAVVTVGSGGGITRVASSNAPNKVSDPSTDEGLTAIRAQIDQIEKVFIREVAAGRDVSTDTVKADFGKGGIVLAEQALKNNMIDGIASAHAGESIETAAISGQTQTEYSGMNIDELKAQHPGVYAAAVEDGKALGVKEERDRVEAHLTLGKSSGDMDTALAAVSSGDGLTASLQAKYMAAGMNRNDSTDRANDDAEASAALDGADQKTNVQAKTDNQAIMDDVASAICSHFDYQGGE